MAVFDAFLELKGIEGESTDSKMKGKIELHSFSVSCQQSGTQHHGSGGGAGRVRMSDIHCTKLYDKASVELFLSCCTGKHFEEATLTMRKAGGEQEPFLIIKLKDVMVCSYNMGGHSKGELPVMDDFALNYGSIHKEYKVQDAKGSVGSPVKGGWSCKENKKL